MATREEQTQRRMAIELLNAQTRAAELEQKKRQFSQDYEGNRVIQPNENDVLATYAEGMNPNVGTTAGGGAFLQGVNYMSPDAAPAFSPVGGASDMDAPTGPIEPDLVAPQEDLENVEGYTDVYYDSVKKLNDLASFAASNGINIKSPDPDSEDQRNLSNYYNKLYTETLYLGDRLKTGLAAQKEGAKTGYLATAPTGRPTEFKDLVRDELEPVDKFNASVKTDGYSDAKQYNAVKERYNDMRDELLEIRDDYIKQGMDNDAKVIDRYINALKEPTYNGNEKQRIAQAWERLKLDKKKGRENYWKNKSKYTQAQDIAVLVSRAFKDKSSYEYDMETGRLVNNSFNRLKYGPNQIIESLELVGYDGLTNQQWRDFSNAQKDFAELQQIEKSGALTTDQKTKKAELKATMLKFKDEFGSKEPKIKVNYVTTSSKGITEGEVEGYEGETTVKSGSDILAGIKPFVNVLGQYNSKLVDNDVITEIGLEKGWLTTTGDWNPDAIIGDKYKKTNLAFDGYLMAAKGNYETTYQLLENMLANPVDYSDWRDGTTGLEDYDDDPDYTYEDGKAVVNRQHMYFNVTDSKLSNLTQSGMTGIHVYKSMQNDDSWDIVFSLKGADVTGVTEENTINIENFPGLRKIMGENWSGTKLREITRDQVMAFLRGAKIVQNSPNYLARARKINEMHDDYKKNNIKYTKNELIKESGKQSEGGSKPATGEEKTGEEKTGEEETIWDK